MQSDDLIILDLLIYVCGNKAEIESWEEVKETLKRLAHGKRCSKSSE